MRVYYSPKHALRDSKFELHDGQIVEPFERPSRMEYILKELDKRGYNDILTPSDQGLDVTLKLHRADYIDFLTNVHDEWKALGKGDEAMTYIWPAATMRSDVIPRQIEARLGYYSMSSDTTITKGTWEAALASKDCAQAGALDLAANGRSVFALCRPPGHHAASYQFGGYCFINNAGVAAQTLLDQGAKRVSILDVDFHHGNGTQEIFYDRSDVQFLSLHGDPVDCFPYFLGYADEKGEGAGIGFNHNYPLSEGTSYDKWSEALDQACAEIAKYRPDALVISLGVDTYEHDPISAFKLKSANFLDYGRRLAKLGIPTMFVMEGGYAIDDIGVNTVNVLDGFLKG